MRQSCLPWPPPASSQRAPLADPERSSGLVPRPPHRPTRHQGGSSSRCLGEQPPGPRDSPWRSGEIPPRARRQRPRKGSSGRRSPRTAPRCRIPRRATSGRPECSTTRETAARPGGSTGRRTAHRGSLAPRCRALACGPLRNPPTHHSMPNAKAEKPRPASFANWSESLSQAECYASSLHPRAILLASSLFAYDGSVTGNSNTTTAISHMTITEKRNVFKAVSVDSEQSSTREKHQVKNRYRTKNAAGNINWRGSNVSSDALASRSGTSHIQITTTSASFLGCFCITFWVRARLSQPDG